MKTDERNILSNISKILLYPLLIIFILTQCYHSTGLNTKKKYTNLIYAWNHIFYENSCKMYVNIRRNPNQLI